MRLNDWQRELETYLLGTQSQPNAVLRDSLLGSSALSAEDGLAIYHNAYRMRLLDVLREDYEALHHWLGDEEFEKLAGAYLQAHPSDFFTLRWLGARLAEFLEGYLIAAQSAPLAELARLEWAFTLAFDATDGEPLSMHGMATLPAEDWPGLQVRLHPSVQWQICHYNSLALWRAAKAGEELPASTPLEQQQVCLIWRQGLISQYRSLDPAEAEALHGMTQQGWSFAELCGQLSEHGEAAPLQAATWLKQWVDEGLLLRHA